MIDKETWEVFIKPEAQRLSHGENYRVVSELYGVLGGFVKDLESPVKNLLLNDDKLFNSYQHDLRRLSLGYIPSDYFISYYDSEEFKLWSGMNGK